MSAFPQLWTRRGLAGVLVAPALLLAACASPVATPAPAALPPASLATAAAPSAGAPAAPRPTAIEVVDDVVLAIHGGAGTILRENMTPELERAYRAKLAEALLAGHGVLARGGSSLDAVGAAIAPLEDSHLFNAGRGAVLNDEGEVELDASIMDGASGMAGAVAGVRTVRHPVQLARRVMDDSEHVLLSGAGADAFAETQQLEREDPDWFVTPHRRRQLELLQAKAADEFAAADRPGDPALLRNARYGTVGCVALDRAGHLAAGTSTGGMARKAFGRIGDSPIIGAGTWADDRTCAVSCTGWGEFFIRRAIAHQIHARMLYGGAGIEGAAHGAVMEDLPRGGGSGGCVALDREGRLAAPFTTPGMYRAWIDAQGRMTIRIHGDERD